MVGWLFNARKRDRTCHPISKLCVRGGKPIFEAHRLQLIAIGCKRNIGTDLAAVAWIWRSVCRTTNREENTKEGLFVDELLALVGG